MPQRNNVLIWLNGGGSKNDRYHCAAAYQGTCRNSGSFVPFDVVGLVFSEERKATRKLCATITAIGATVLSSLVQAEGITGIYSCSSGVNNDRPVTYMFNSDLMVRDGAQSAPFEFVTALNGGKLLYVGIRPTRDYDPELWRYGTRSSDLERWLPEEKKRLELIVGTGQIDETDEDYPLVNAVSCQRLLSQESVTSKYFRQRSTAPSSPWLPGVVPIFTEGGQRGICTSRPTVRHVGGQVKNHGYY